ncbi:MAG: hypothetical protein ACPG06_02000 [Alphaproteobacteria bacterium]
MRKLLERVRCKWAQLVGIAVSLTDRDLPHLLCKGSRFGDHEG